MRTADAAFDEFDRVGYTEEYDNYYFLTCVPCRLSFPPPPFREPEYEASNTIRCSAVTEELKNKQQKCGL